VAITAFSQWSTTAALNVDLNSIPLDGASMTAGQVDDAFREMMAQLKVGVYLGTTTNDSASAGQIGQIISSNIAVGSAVSLTTSTPANVSSISLTAGDWDVYAQTGFLPGATTSITAMISSISQTSATLDISTAGAGQIYRCAAFVPNAVSMILGSTGPVRISLASTTTIYHVAQSTFTVSTQTAFGNIRARRVR
jgi:hypothetical protein